MLLGVSSSALVESFKLLDGLILNGLPVTRAEKVLQALGSSWLLEAPGRVVSFVGMKA